jgi:hypothetical protein
MFETVFEQIQVSEKSGYVMPNFQDRTKSDFRNSFLFFIIARARKYFMMMSASTAKDGVHLSPQDTVNVSLLKNVIDTCDCAVASDSTTSPKSKGQITPTPRATQAVGTFTTKAAETSEQSITLHTFEMPPPAPLTGGALGGKQGSKRLSISPPRNVELSDRLYSKAMELKEKRDTLHRRASEEFTFKPNIKKPAVKGAPVVPENPTDKDRFVSLHEQAYEVARRKEELMQKAIAQFTYKPRLSEKSRRLFAKKMRQKKAVETQGLLDPSAVSAHNAVSSPETAPTPPTTSSNSSASLDSTIPRRVDELYSNYLEIEAKRKEKQEKLEKKASEECTFQPKIKILKGKKAPQNHRPLYDAERERQKRVEKERKKVDREMKECTFKPQTRPGLSSAKGDASTETKLLSQLSFFDRLQETEKKKFEKRENLRKELEERETKEETFCPKINESKRNKTKQDDERNNDIISFHERLFEKEYQQAVEAERMRKKLEQEASFSFKPNIRTQENVKVPGRQGGIFEVPFG